MEIGLSERLHIEQKLGRSSYYSIQCSCAFSKIGQMAV